MRAGGDEGGDNYPPSPPPPAQKNAKENCHLQKHHASGGDKIGGKPWKVTNYRNLVLTTMDIFDLIDVQRVKHPKLRKYSYESKALKMKSRIDFFLLLNIYNNS